MNNRFILFLLFLLTIAQANAQKLTLIWASDTVLRVPESVLLDTESDLLYVANINGKSDQKDGDGFISRMSTDGKIEDLKWLTGLDAPKGMALVKQKLYVADISNVVIVDVAKATILKKIPVEGAKFLNDVTAAENGDIFVSDSGTGKIHLIKDGKATIYFESESLKRVNGLLALPNTLYVADAGDGTNYKLSKDKRLEKFTTTSQGADGVVKVGKDEYFVSSWGGEVFHVAPDGTATKMLDTKDQKLNSADIAYDAKTRTVFVPTFFGNTVMAYRFSR